VEAARNLATRYDLPTLAWEPVAAALASPLTQAPGTGGPDRHTCWLATVDPDGAPHVTGIGGFWDGETWWWNAGAATRKARNLARDPRCTLSLSLHEADLVFEGTAAVVDDPDEVARFAATARAGGWPAEVDPSGTALTAEFSAPSAGPPPWQVWRMALAKVTALWVVEPGGATTFTP
jgi:hypothetical protein